MGKEEKYRNWKKEKSTEAWKEYKKSRQNVKKGYFLSKGKETEGMCNDLNDPNHRNEIFLIAKQTVKERQDITGSNCLKGVSGK